jgi:hypothetical protein
MEEYKRYRCPGCNRVHAAIPLAEAEHQIVQTNEFLVSEGELPTASLATYLRCCGCGTETTKFVAANADDGYFLATLQCVVVPAMAYPVTDVGGYITGLAKLHGVSYVKTSYDELAEVITRLSDDDVVMDETELLLIALERAGVIPSEAVVPLHINYLREKLSAISSFAPNLPQVCPTCQEDQ